MCNIPPKSQLLEKSDVLRAEVAGRMEARVGWEKRLDRQSASNARLSPPVFLRG